MASTRVAIVAALLIGLPSLSSAQDQEPFGPQITAAPPTGAQGRRAGETGAEGASTPPSPVPGT